MPPSAAADAVPPRVASYTIEARLDATKKAITARERLHWQNTSSESAPYLYFHLYLNAFANNRTTLMREYQSARGRGALDHWRDGWGSMEIRSIRVDGQELVQALRPAHPDDSNLDDRTVMRLRLAKPIPPGRSVDVDIAFTAQLPKLLLRSGYLGDFFMVAQWFPKVGVYRDGEWSCHQYHLASEFFSDFGVYDVSLTVPADLVVGATGERVEEWSNGDGTRTMRYRAENVHDFAWAADPRFQTVADRFGDVDVRLLCRPADCGAADRHLGATRQAMRWFEKHIGPYPYRTLTLVDPGLFGDAAAGMEYPTLFTVGPSRWIPRGIRIPEWVAVHEFGHQYWQGIVANDEAEEAWLDEGVNSYTEDKVLKAAYGPASVIDLLGLQADSLTMHRASFMMSGSLDPIMQPAWQFLDLHSYHSITYSKTALVLHTLESDIGEERLLQALRAYYERWRYRHPRGEDFIRSLSDSSGEDLQGFFDQTLRSSGVADYAVTHVDVSPVQAFAGADVGSASEPVASAPSYHSTVLIERLGTVQLPVDIDVLFADGPETHERWDGKSRWRRFDYTGSQRVIAAVVDPAGKIPLDINPINNSRMQDPASRGLVRLGVRWGVWFQMLLQLLTVP